MRKIISFDFDGVIHSFDSPWEAPDIIPDPPVDGIRNLIAELRDLGFKVIVSSSRCSGKGGKEAILEYLDKYKIKVDDVTAEKVASMVHIDDRAITFTGDTEGLLEEIKSFTPWNRPGELPVQTIE